MRIIPFIFVTLYLFASLATAVELSDNVRKLSNSAIELSKILQATTTMQANFHQTVHDRNNKTLHDTYGSMAINKPKLFRWQIIKPETNLIIVDGKNFWNYDEELQQVTVQDVDDSYENSPISLFLTANINDIGKKYIINKLPCKEEGTITRARFELIPTNEVDSFSKVELIFTAGIINSLVLIDQLGQITNIEFTNVQTNIKILPALFQFTPPQDIDVIKLNI